MSLCSRPMACRQYCEEEDETEMCLTSIRLTTPNLPFLRDTPGPLTEGLLPSVFSIPVSVDFSHGASYHLPRQ